MVWHQVNQTKRAIPSQFHSPFERKYNEPFSKSQDKSNFIFYKGTLLQFYSYNNFVTIFITWRYRENEEGKWILGSLQSALESTECPRDVHN